MLCFDVQEDILAVSILNNANFETKYFHTHFNVQYAYNRPRKHSHQSSRVIIGVNIAPKEQLPGQHQTFSLESPYSDYLAQVLVMADTRENKVKVSAGIALVVEPPLVTKKEGIQHTLQREGYEVKFVAEPPMILRGYYWDYGIVIKITENVSWVAVVTETESRILLKDKKTKKIAELKNYKPIKQKHTPLYYMELENTKPEEEQYTITPNEAHDFIIQHNKGAMLLEKVILTGTFGKVNNDLTLDEYWVMQLTGLNSQYHVHITPQEARKYDAVNGMKSLGKLIQFWKTAS